MDRVHGIGFSLDQGPWFQEFEIPDNRQAEKGPNVVKLVTDVNSGTKGSNSICNRRDSRLIFRIDVGQIPLFHKRRGIEYDFILLILKP